MHRHQFTSKQIRESAAQQTSELREMARSLSFWMDGVHYPSEGHYLEYVTRSYLRRRIPQRFEVSTGFISTLESNTQNDEEPQFTRKVSRQFDILIWDAENFPPLFRADDFVIVIPEAVKAVIEITKCLNTAKAREDLEKFDDLYELYSWERQRFRPYTAMLAFSSKHRMTDLLQVLERFYLFDSNIPVPFRYKAVRAKGLDTRKVAIPGFIDSMCVLDRGLLKGRVECIEVDPERSIVRYVAYANEPGLEDSFGFFERDLVSMLSQSAAEASGSWEPPVDVYREFRHIASQGVKGSLRIEDWGSILPSLNVIEKILYSPNSSNDTPNVSKFVGADFLNDHPSPTMYIEHFGPNIWAFEQHSEHIFACGHYSQDSRVGKWRLFGFHEDQRQSRNATTDSLKKGEKNFLEILKLFEALHEKSYPVVLSEE